MLMTYIMLCCSSVWTLKHVQTFAAIDCFCHAVMLHMNHKCMGGALILLLRLCKLPMECTNSCIVSSGANCTAHFVIAMHISNILKHSYCLFSTIFKNLEPSTCHKLLLTSSCDLTEKYKTFMQILCSYCFNSDLNRSSPLALFSRVRSSYGLTIVSHYSMFTLS